jgi:hypothetical protein
MCRKILHRPGCSDGSAGREDHGHDGVGASGHIIVQRRQAVGIQLP